jgi:GMP synthase (glutamine-hydrolysing)
MSKSIIYILFTGLSNEKMNLYGVQFHPEVDLTDNGKQMLKNFLFNIAKCEGIYTMMSREDSCIKYIKETVGDHKVLVSIHGPGLYKEKIKGS